MTFHQIKIISNSIVFSIKKKHSARLQIFNVLCSLLENQLQQFLYCLYAPKDSVDPEITILQLSYIFSLNTVHILALLFSLQTRAC